MFMSPEKREAAEIAAAENWAKWHRRKKLITVPLKAVGIAVVLSFAYTTGEHAGVDACTPPITRESR